MWLLESAMRATLERNQHAKPTEAQQARYDALFHDDDSPESSRLLTVAGNTAEIAVIGVLTNKPDIMAMIFGGGNTTYAGIAQALAQAEANPDVTNAVLRIDSPGGSFAGLFDGLAAVEAFSKPLTAQVSGMAASAAYAIASQCDSIIAKNIATQVGSVGVAARIYTDDDEVVITSTNAPKKIPDVRTEEGVAMVREEIDAMHDIFVESIAKGRHTTPGNINANFGQGATILAENALDRGMIDSIGAGHDQNTITSENPMDLVTLKSQHPAVYAEACAAATEDAVAQERDRVTAHLTLGEASGDMKTAIAAIKDGSGMTASINAAYLAAGMNRRDIEARAEDDDQAGKGADSADNGDEVSTADLVADIVAEKFGYEERI